MQAGGKGIYVRTLLRLIHFLSYAIWFTIYPPPHKADFHVSRGTPPGPENPEDGCLTIHLFTTLKEIKKRNRQFGFDVVAHPVKNLLVSSFSIIVSLVIKAVHRSFLGVLLVKRTGIGFLLSCRVY